ncbi:MAG TPA: T9SS type A sorting domain-containing protein, partial [Prolixibacteraceae bacterium]|nr:T9SS type A sorting domain-containing protein [Prolixibacteraceae bacterium]
SHNYVNVTNDTNIGNLKQFLANYNNAIIAIDANYYPSLTSNDLWTSDSYLATGSNHANLIVGYDDNFGPYTEGGVSKYGAFKVANSWGKGNWENVYDGFYWISYECMKQKIGSYMFFEDRVDYIPEVISVFSMEHSLRGECDVTIGIGNSSSPNATKRFDDYWSNGGNHAYPTNVMVMDITEFGTPEIDDNFFIKVYDKGTATVGKINSFSVEVYDDYSSGTPLATFTSDNTPVNTVHQGNVYVQLQIVSSVPLDLDISTTTVTSSDNQCFNARNNIVVAGTGNVIVQSGASANFIAGHSVQFLPGFHAVNGSYVDAHITTNGSFCDQLPPPLMLAYDPPVEKSVDNVEPNIEEADLPNTQSMLVYPNPSNGQFILLLNNFEGVTRVFIYNAMGQKVYDVSISDEKHFVELPNVQRGIYFVKAINKQKQFDQKIVIK